MRTPPPGGSVESMGTPPLRMVIELDPGDPIAGRIEVDDRPTQPFHGWLELSSRLERLRADVADAAPTSPDQKGPTVV